MTITNLANVAVDDIVACFVEAFSDYFVPIPSDPNYFKNRWKASKVDFSMSYGAFQGDNLVAFILHGIDVRNGQKIAYNAGTGVIPSFRGRRIVKAIYDVAIPKLKQAGIAKSVLEVITLNEKAIKSYKGVGFSITKTLKCFDGKIPEVASQNYHVEEVAFDEVDWNKIPYQESYCWDHHPQSLNEEIYRFFKVMCQSEPKAFFVVNKSRDRIAQWEVLSNTEGAWSALMTAISTMTDKVQINNVDDKRKDKIKYLIKAGLKNVVDQYEMQILLS